VDAKGFRLADEIGYIQDKAADHDGRIVTIGQLSFAIERKGRYRIEGPTFIYADRNTGRVATILGYPHKNSPKPADLKI
jgi:hypothetical protein